MSNEAFEGEMGFTTNQLLAAYHQAAEQRDTAAMEQLHGAIQRSYQREVPRATDDMSGTERFVAGMGHGMQRLGEGTANLLHLRGKATVPGTDITFDSTDQGLRDEDKSSRDLLSTRGGFWGDIAGQAAATAPLGMGVGAATRAGGAALTRAAVPGAKILSNALKTAQASAEGAHQGAAMASPDEQGAGARSGAVLGAVLNKLGQAGGRLTRGLVEKSDAAQRLIDAAAAQGRKLFLPISQAARTGEGAGIASPTAKLVYQRMLPYALGVDTRLEGQSAKAADTLNKVRADMSRPAFLRENGGVTPTATTAGKTGEATAANLSEAHAADLKKSFDDYAFQVPVFNFRDQVVRNLEAMHPNIPDALKEQLANKVDENMQLFTKDGQVTGENLRSAMESATRDLDGLGKNYKATWKDSAIQPMRDIIDFSINHHREILGNPASSGTDKALARQFLDDMENYKSLAAHDPDVEAVVRSTAGVPELRGDYPAKAALRNEIPGTPGYRLQQDRHEVLESEDPGSVSPAGRHAWQTFGAVAPVMGGLATGHGAQGAEGALALAGGAHALAFPGMQNALYGDTAAQKYMADFLRSYPTVSGALGRAARAGAVGINEDRNTDSLDEDQQ